MKVAYERAGGVDPGRWLPLPDVRKRYVVKRSEPSRARYEPPEGVAEGEPRMKLLRLRHEDRSQVQKIVLHYH